MKKRSPQKRNEDVRLCGKCWEISGKVRGKRRCPSTTVELLARGGRPTKQFRSGKLTENYPKAKPTNGEQPREKYIFEVDDKIRFVFFFENIL